MITVLTSQRYTTTVVSGTLVSVLTPDQSLITTIGSPGPQGPKGDNTESFEAGASLSGHRAIRVESGLAYVCDGAVVGHAGSCIGISTGAAMVGELAIVQTSGVMTEPSWNWLTGPVFVGLNGVLTQSLAGVAFVQQVGVAVSPTAMHINSHLPIVLS